MKYLLICLAAMLLTGCGHNVLVYTAGKRLNFGFNPQTQETGVQYLDAEQVSVIEKDNAKLTVELSNVLNEDGKATQRISKIVYEIGEQITGSDVDHEKAKAAGGQK